MAQTVFKGSNVVPLESFFEDSRRLGLEDFGRQHGQAFLVHHGSVGRFQQPEDMKSTVKIESGDGDVAGGAGPFNPRKDFAVFPVRHVAGGATEEDLIWVGRSEENDIVIPDESVSAVHAFIRKAEGGKLVIQDMNSMNGTYINNQTVPPQGMGDPEVLESGVRVRFGSVKLTFLEIPEFVSLVIQLRD